MEFGHHTARISFFGRNGPDLLFGLAGMEVFRTANLKIDLVNGELAVSMLLLDKNGKLSAQLMDNEWKVESFPQTWDRNYDDDALEVKIAGGISWPAPNVSAR
jgi:hypothetical protein